MQRAEHGRGSDDVVVVRSSERDLLFDGRCERDTGLSQAGDEPSQAHDEGRRVGIRRVLSLKVLGDLQEGGVSGYRRSYSRCFGTPATATHSTASLVAEDLLPRDPSIFIREVHPASEDLEGEIVIPRADQGEVEPFVPVKPAREEAPTRRRRQQLVRFRSLRIPRWSSARAVGVPFLRERSVDDGRAVPVADATDEIGRDRLSKVSLAGRERRGDLWEQGIESVLVRG